MDEKTENRLGKIEALLAKTVDNGCTQEEATAAAEAAQRLMTTWGLEEAMLRVGRKVGVEEIATMLIPISGYWFKQRMRLYSYIATVNDCKCAYRNPSKVVKGGILATGFKEDIERTKILAHRLDAHMMHSLRGKSTSHAWKVSFLEGYCMTINMRLTRIKREATEAYKVHTPGTALAVIDKGKQVADAFETAHGKLRYSKNSGPKNFNSDGYRSGQDAGARANISTAELGR
jgi:hypothetical protein